MRPTIEIYCVILGALSGHFLDELLVEGVVVKDAVNATTVLYLLMAHLKLR